MLMENFLRSKVYSQVIEHQIPAPTNEERLTEVQQKDLEALKLKDLKAKNYLFQAIDHSFLKIILCKETSKDIWDSMKTKYQGLSRVKRAQLQALRREFKIGDIAIVEKILRSLSPKYDYVVCSIEESKDIDTLKLDEL
ncbi:hypothetical protein GQ457_09G016070 [Hibiscus cannabinus]